MKITGSLFETDFLSSIVGDNTALATHIRARKRPHIWAAIREDLFLQCLFWCASMLSTSYALWEIHRRRSLNLLFGILNTSAFARLLFKLSEVRRPWRCISWIDSVSRRCLFGCDLVSGSATIATSTRWWLFRWLCISLRLMRRWHILPRCMSLVRGASRWFLSTRWVAKLW